MVVRKSFLGREKGGIKEENNNNKKEKRRKETLNVRGRGGKQEKERVREAKNRTNYVG